MERTKGRLALTQKTSLHSSLLAQHPFSSEKFKAGSKHFHEEIQQHLLEAFDLFARSRIGLQAPGGKRGVTSKSSLAL
jgi:hypothetical protein